jgi:1-acyl-sn-glycerol-3-phosphate acyltransferase
MSRVNCIWWSLPKARDRQSRHWKTGFYYIALEAHVPIVLGYLDFGGAQVHRLGASLHADRLVIEADIWPSSRLFTQLFKVKILSQFVL